MTFAEAIHLLLQGKTLTRQTEANDCRYLLESKKQGTMNWSKADNSNFGFFVFTREDFEATDWEISEDDICGYTRCR